jgi:hypothetical protein
MINPICIAMLAMTMSGMAQPLEWKQKFSTPNLLHGTIVLPEEQLTIRSAEKVSKVVLADSRDKAFVDVELFAAEHFPPFHYLMASHVGYDWWFNWSKRVPDAPTARIVVINGATALEYRAKRGTVTRQILNGRRDPLTLSAPVGTFTLLHFTFKPIPLAASKGLEPESLEVFAETTRRLNESNGIAFLTELHKAIPVADITLYLRNDTWFLDVPGYPLRYPFREKQSPPTRESFMSSTTLTCGTAIDHKYSCSASTGQ